MTADISAAPSGGANALAAGAELFAHAQHLTQYGLDRIAPLQVVRWGGLMFMCIVYCLRVYFLQGFYIVTYGLGIFLLNQFIGFLTPLSDDVTDDDVPSPNASVLPLSQSPTDGEFKPFERKMSEFKFWLSCTKAFLTAVLMTFFSIFDIPVYWPILLIYFIVLFVLTMKRQIRHMIKHKYLPFSWGKKNYVKSSKPMHDDIRSK